MPRHGKPIDQLDSGKWRARYRGPDNKQHSKSFKHYEDAEAWLDSQRVSKREGSWVDPNSEAMPYREWVAKWMVGRRVRLRASTLARDGALMDGHVLARFGDLPLREIAQHDVQEWVADLASSGLAPATVGKCYQLLSASLAKAVSASHLRQSPCQGIELPAVEREEMRFLTAGEVSTLATAMPERWRALVLVAAYGGLRIGELGALRRDRIDPLRSTVDIRVTAGEVRGRLVTNAPKTKASRRVVTLPRPVMAALVEHLDQYSSAEPDGLVFVTSTGCPLRVPTWRRRVWAPAVRAAGLEPLRIHDLRHTAVALWIDRGATLLQVKQRAGHTSSTFTLDRYGHLYENNDEALLAGLDAGYVPVAAEADVVPLRPAEGSP